MVALTKGENPLKLVEVVENWSMKNGMELNKKKGKSAFLRLSPKK